MNPISWAEFGVRTAIQMGADAFRLITAMSNGDVDTVKALSEVLDEPDRILARGHALEVQMRQEEQDRLHNNT